MSKRSGINGGYGSMHRGGRRRRSNRGNNLIVLLLILVVAVGLGFTAYNLSKKNLGERPNPNDMSQILTPMITAAPTEVGSSNPGDGDPTGETTISPMPTELPTETPTPTLEPTPTPEPTPTTNPDITPTPTPKPAWNEGYLIGFEDNRVKVDVKGAYAGLGLYLPSKVEEWCNLADTSELNALVIDIKADSGKVTYKMDNEAIAATGVTINHFKDMKSLLATLKEHGIYTIARVVCFRDPYIGSVHPEYMLYTKDGDMYEDKDGINWINPYNQDAWKYIVDISEQAVLDGFDEICFDYIRVSTNGMSNVDFGDIPEGTTLQDTITAFTKYACNRLKPQGAFVSASVYGAVIRSSIDAQNIGQNYLDMSRYLDYICPMVYPSHYAAGYAGFDVPDADPYGLIKYEMDSSVKKLSVLPEEQETYADVRPWLQAFTASWVKGHLTYNGSVIRKQVDATYDAGYNGWMLWNAGAKYVDGCFVTEE